MDSYSEPLNLFAFGFSLSLPFAATQQIFLDFGLGFPSFRAQMIFI